MWFLKVLFRVLLVKDLMDSSNGFFLLNKEFTPLQKNNVNYDLQYNISIIILVSNSHRDFSYHL